MAALSVVYRRHRDELADLRHSLQYVDLAIRNCRVIARRLTSVINHAALSDDALAAISEVVDDTADAVDTLSKSLSGSDPAERAHSLRQARTDLAEIATRLHPRHLAASGLEAEGFVLLLRPLLVDLLQAAGIRHDEAAGYLPKL